MEWDHIEYYENPGPKRRECRGVVTVRLWWFGTQDKAIVLPMISALAIEGFLDWIQKILCGAWTALGSSRSCRIPVPCPVCRVFARSTL